MLSQQLGKTTVTAAQSAGLAGHPFPTENGTPLGECPRGRHAQRRGGLVVRMPITALPGVSSMSSPGTSHSPRNNSPGCHPGHQNPTILVPIIPLHPPSLKAHTPAPSSSSIPRLCSLFTMNLIAGKTKPQVISYRKTGSLFLKRKERGSDLHLLKQ